MKKIAICSIKIFIFFNLIFAETGNIEGYVHEKNTDRVIKGANIILKGTEKGDFTDLNGYFSIENLPTGKLLAINTCN